MAAKNVADLIDAIYVQERNEDTDAQCEAAKACLLYTSLVLGGQDELAAEEAIRMVVQRGQRTVAEAEEPGVDVPLVALYTLAPVSYTHLDVYKRQAYGRKN